MTKDEKLTEARELKKASEGLIAGYFIGLIMAYFFVAGDTILFGVFAALFFGLFASIAIYWHAKLSGLEAEDDNIVEKF